MSDALLAAYDAVLFDLDGTVYQGTHVFPGSTDVLRELRDQGVAIRFVTNNASKAPQDVVDHLRELGITADTAEVNTSTQAAVAVLRDRLDQGSQVLVVGADALEAAVAEAGLQPVRENGPDVAAVVQGHSPDTGWRILAEACLALRAGALWVACNVDATLPTERGLLPGNGSMVAVLRTATELEPFIAGKPSPTLFTTAAESAGARLPLAVGDRLDTDIAGGVAAGFDTLAVLTGVATPALLLAAPEAQRPRYVAADLGGLRASRASVEIGPRDAWRIETEDGELVVANNSPSDDLELLRALCGPAWEFGTTKVRGTDDASKAAIERLGLG
ncbi:MAG: glycerol-phosphatase [Pseudonocardiales bacterium]|jgi:HAD superfamily hydrolase (TIGR01457 family)|nr:glycerol-phosphatase [Pseudonocardiales bacterium]